jgi:hypothetical protein
MIGRQVDADLASRRGDEEDCPRLQLHVVTWPREEAGEHRVLHEVVAFRTAHGAGQRSHHGVPHGLTQQLKASFCVVDGGEEDDDLTVELCGLCGKAFGQLFSIIDEVQLQTFSGVESLVHDRIVEVLVAERKIRFGATRSRKRNHLERAGLVAAELLVRDGSEQRLKRGLEVRLIVYKQHVLPEEPSVQRLAAEATTVSTEKQPATDHVDGADHNSWARWISPPRTVVGELATKSADGQRMLSGHRRQRIESIVDVSRFRLKELAAQALGLSGGLVNHRAPVDDVYEPPR